MFFQDVKPCGKMKLWRVEHFCYCIQQSRPKVRTNMVTFFLGQPLTQTSLCVSCYVDLQNSKNKCSYIFGEIRYFACQSYFRSFPYIQYTRKMKPNNTNIRGTPVKKFIMCYWKCWQSFRMLAQSLLVRSQLERVSKSLC